MLNIIPKVGNRSLFLGQTGSGKTFCMLHLLGAYYGRYQIQILNTKGDPSIDALDAPVVRHIDEVHLFRWPKYPVVIYEPDGDELHDLEILDDWCQWIYDRQNTVAVIDELTQVASGAKARPGFLNLITRGRIRNCTVFLGTQRPAWVPKIAYTEAQHFYKFYLADADDRKRVASVTHPAMMGQPKYKHGFHYFEVGTRKVYEFRSIIPDALIQNQPKEGIDPFERQTDFGVLDRRRGGGPIVGREKVWD